MSAESSLGSKVMTSVPCQGGDDIEALGEELAAAHGDRPCVGVATAAPYDATSSPASDGTGSGPVSNRWALSTGANVPSGSCSRRPVRRQRDGEDVQITDVQRAGGVRAAGHFCPDTV